MLHCRNSRCKYYAGRWCCGCRFQYCNSWR
nr:MAG TPA: toxin [Caudoviricetes sp.]